jgi:adenosine deaminase
MLKGTHRPCRNPNEWDKLAKWVINNKLVSHNVRWLIQVPRLYEVFKGGGLINNFEEVVKSTSMAPTPLVGRST